VHVARVIPGILLVVPGLAGIVELRPYEYNSYNPIRRWDSGAEGLFPHDDWCSSYREGTGCEARRRAERRSAAPDSNRTTGP